MDKVNGALREKGINFDVRSVKSEDVEELIEALGDMEVDVVSARGERLRYLSNNYSVMSLVS
jgi:hypothetical protein